VTPLPFELKAEMVPLKVKQGDKVKLKITAVRKTYQGPINVELRNLPAKTDAQKGMIAQGQTAVELEVTVAADAPPGDKADVQAAGVAVMLGNLTLTSPAFTVSVQAK
jgi:hypothetical protein